MDILQVLGAFGYAVGLAGLGAVIWFSVRHSYGKATIDALQTDVNNWKNRVDERDARIENLEEEARRKDAAVSRMGSQIESQERQIADLRELVLQRAEFHDLVELTKQHEANAVRRAEDRSKEHATMFASLNSNADIGHEIVLEIKKVQRLLPKQEQKP